MSKLLLLISLIVVFVASTCTVYGFSPPSTIKKHNTISQTATISSFHPSVILTRSSANTLTSLKEKNDSTSTSESTNKKSGIDRKVSNKLLAETIAPFRGLRLFFYGAFASGAFVGGLITASGVAAALSGVRTDLDLNTEYMNLAIDFGAVTLFAVLAKLDLDKGAELDGKVEQKVERTKTMKKVKAAMREREAQLKELNVNVRVSEDGSMKEAPIGVMQEKAKQHLILVAGPGRAIRDALRGAQLNKVNFGSTNILVVPYETGKDAADRAAKPDGSGFGDARPLYETQAYVAEPVGSGWEEFIEDEMAVAGKSQLVFCRVI